MTTTSRPGSKPLEFSKWERAVILLLLLVLFCIVPISLTVLVFTFPVLANVFRAGMAAVAIASSIWLIIQQKRLSVFAVALVLYGALLIVSTSIQDTYAIMIEPLPYDVRDTIRYVIDLKRLAQGIGDVGSGVLWFGLGWLRFRIWLKEGRSIKETKHFLNIFMATLLAMYAATHMYLGILRILSALRW